MITDLTPEQFARKYVGHMVRCIGDKHCVPASIRELPDLRAKIIGYSWGGDGVIISFDEFNEGWPIERCDHIILQPAKYGWWIQLQYIELVEKTTQTLPKLYSKKCPYCKSNARRVKQLTFCSNTKCKKSRANLKKAINYRSYKKESSVDAQNFVLCSTCKKRCVYTDVIDGKRLYTNSIETICKNHHILPHEFVDGQLIIYGDKSVMWRKGIGFVYHKLTGIIRR